MTKSRYKGNEVPVTESYIIWLFDNGSAEMNINKQEKNTQAVQWRLKDTTLTLTLYSELIETLQFDGTYLILEQPVFGPDDIDYLIFEKMS